MWIPDDRGPAEEQEGWVLGYSPGFRWAERDLGRTQSSRPGSRVQWPGASSGYSGWSLHYSATRYKTTHRHTWKTNTWYENVLHLDVIIIWGCPGTSNTNAKLTVVILKMSKASLQNPMHQLCRDYCCNSYIIVAVLRDRCEWIGSELDGTDTRAYLSVTQRRACFY